MATLLDQHDALSRAILALSGDIKANAHQLTHIHLGTDLSFPAEQHPSCNVRTEDERHTLDPAHPPMCLYRIRRRPDNHPKPSFDSHHAQMSAQATAARITRAAVAIDKQAMAFALELRRCLGRAAPGWTSMVQWQAHPTQPHGESGLSISFDRIGGHSLHGGRHFCTHATPEWAIQRRRLDAICAMTPPGPDAQPWTIFIQSSRGRGTWDHSRPHHATSSADAIARCVALEWPDLFTGWKDGEVWAGVMPAPIPPLSTP